MHPFHVALARALSQIPDSTPDPYAVLLEHGTLEIGIYTPRGNDYQSPHTRDEVYVVVRGSGWFVNGTDRHAFGAGDALFVPAGRPHRFEEFSDDLTVWVLFYGPQGGERPAAAGEPPA
ncbi:MAG: cupin domain-containing protein [Gemmatimonadales bacterium]